MEHSEHSESEFYSLHRHRIKSSVARPLLKFSERSLGTLTLNSFIGMYSGIGNFDHTLFKHLAYLFRKLCIHSKAHKLIANPTVALFTVLSRRLTLVKIHAV